MRFRSSSQTLRSVSRSAPGELENMFLHIDELSTKLPIDDVNSLVQFGCVQ